jgi:hypothetical protein
MAADGIPVAVACRVLGFSKQAFYAWKAAPVTERDWSDAHLINAALDVHRDDPGVRVPVHRRRARRLHNAIAFRDPEGTVVHSDRGSQDGFNRSSQHRVV